MPKCAKCPKPAIIYQRYSGMHLCRSHFADDIHRKTRESLRQTGLFAGGLRLALIMDGSKGSCVMACILKDLFARRRDIELIAVITDDQGPGAEAARLVAGKLGIQSVTAEMPISRKKIEGAGETSLRSSQSRHKIQRACRLAQEIGADALANGCDLDDESTDIFVSYLRGDIAALMESTRGQDQQKPEHRPEQKPDYNQAQPEPGEIPIIRPLRRIPKKEVRLYALCHGLPFSEDAEGNILCKEAYKQLSRFDSRHPGTMYSLLRSQEKLALK